MSLNRINIINIVVWFLLLVIPHLLCEAGVIDLNDWSVHQSNGIISVITGSFLHASYAHLTSNLSSILLGTSLLYTLYKKNYWNVIIPGIILPSLTTYIIGLDSVGISGLVYTTIWFIIISGFISTSYIKFFLSVVLILFYSHTLKGIFPQIPFINIAWQNHLTGFTIGFLMAIFFKQKP